MLICVQNMWKRYAFLGNLLLSLFFKQRKQLSFVTFENACNPAVEMWVLNMLNTHENRRNEDAPKLKWKSEKVFVVKSFNARNPSGSSWRSMWNDEAVEIWQIFFTNSAWSRRTNLTDHGVLECWISRQLKRLMKSWMLWKTAPPKPSKKNIFYPQNRNKNQIK